MADSYADLFHTARLTDTLILLTEDPAVARAMESPRLKREVGVINARATEMQSHYLTRVSQVSSTRLSTSTAHAA